MESARKLASKIGIGIFVVALLLFGLKGCVTTVWTSPEQPTTYAVHGADGRTLAMIFVPENTTYMVYSQRNPAFIRVVRTKMRGTYGTHYFGRLWNLDGPGTGPGIFSFRIYPEGARPVVMETTVLDNFTYGNGNAPLPDEGDKMFPIILFTEGAVKFEGMWLKREPTDTRLLTAVQKKLSAP